MEAYRHGLKWTYRSVCARRSRSRSRSKPVRSVFRTPRSKFSRRICRVLYSAPLIVYHSFPRSLPEPSGVRSIPADLYRVFNNYALICFSISPVKIFRTMWFLHSSLIRNTLTYGVMDTFANILPLLFSAWDVSTFDFQATTSCNHYFFL